MYPINEFISGRDKSKQKLNYGNNSTEINVFSRKRHYCLDLIGQYYISMSLWSAFGGEAANCKINNEKS